MFDRIREVFALYEVYGNERYLDNTITFLQHSSQTAHMATREGFEDEVIVAAFLHNIGSLISQLPKSQITNQDTSFERMGGAFLKERGFPQDVVDLIQSQLIARRYLTHKYSGFYKALSMQQQDYVLSHGGPLDPHDAIDFEKYELFRPSVRLVLWQEKAKEPALEGIHFSVIEAKARYISREIVYT